MHKIQSEQQMKDFGRLIGSLVRGGEVIELIGDVGAGKTTLAKGLAQGMQIDEDVQSPSFTISRTYASPGGLQLSHYDFYRLSDAGIMAHELGDVAGVPDVVTLVEWAGVADDALPRDRLTLTITSPTEHYRDVVVKATGERSKLLAEQLQ